MIERIYRCNLCRDQYEREELTGLRWAPTGERTTLGTSVDGWVLDIGINAEHHLCGRCLKSVARIHSAQEGDPTP